MSDRGCDTDEECIFIDKDTFRNELRALTSDQKMFIIGEYEKLAQEHGVSMREFNSFMLYFDELED